MAAYLLSDCLLATDLLSPVGVKWLYNPCRLQESTPVHRLRKFRRLSKK